MNFFFCTYMISDAKINGSPNFRIFLNKIIEIYYFSTSSHVVNWCRLGPCGQGACDVTRVRTQRINNSGNQAAFMI